MTQKVVVPDIGENVETGTVVGVLVDTGDRVAKDDAIIEIETEKAVVEIPSPAGGVIQEIRVKEGDELHVGDVIAILDTESESRDTESENREVESQQADEPADGKTAAKAADPVQPREEKQSATPETASTRASADEPPETERKAGGHTPAPASPAVRRLARELGVDIYRVNGSGRGGRISAKDVKDHLQNRTDAARDPASAKDSGQSAAAQELPDFSRYGPVETADMSTIRKITADNMAHSWQAIPQVSQFDHADITHLDRWMAMVNRKADNAGSKLTITAVIINVLARGLKRFPRFNASLDLHQQRIVFKHYVHVGVAVATRRGLLVPVVRDADQKSITAVADELKDLAERARSKRLKPDEMAGGSFTLSNQGGIGGTNFTPIVFWPQAAILGVSRATTQPVYENDAWVPKTMLPLVLTYDHRLNDGADAARFLQWICDALENPMSMEL